MIILGCNYRVMMTESSISSRTNSRVGIGRIWGGCRNDAILGAVIYMISQSKIKIKYFPDGGPSLSQYLNWTNKCSLVPQPN